MVSPRHFNQTPVGILRRAVITAINDKPGSGSVSAEIDTASSSIPIGTQKKIFVQIPFAHYSVEGMFIGGRPKVGTPIIVGKGEGTNWYFVSYLVSNFPQLPDMADGELLLQASPNTKLTLNADDTVDLGSNLLNLHFNTSPNKFNNKIQSSFSNQYAFSEVSREITGLVKRELLNNAIVPSSMKLTSEVYDDYLTVIALDPTITSVFTSQSAAKNPPFVEKRETIYEFAYSSNVQDDLTEAAIYSPDQQATNNTTINPTYQLPNRRQSKTDTLSLSLVAPNFLMETTKGTVVDIFGNVLDLNRAPIVGFNQNNPNLTLNSQQQKDISFEAIKVAERKSIGYHFEINARKDLSAGNGKYQLPDITSSADYARSRSRFIFDIDKEGQFKLNVPASSETGNIPLHARYENYSTFGPEDNNNPNKLFFRDDYLDIFLDSFAIGDITVNDDKGVSTPIDRIAQIHIKHGMPFHSVANSALIFQNQNGTNYTTDFLGYQTVFQTINPSLIPTITNIVSPVITTAGSGANAGGRSGSLNFDGSLELSIGANTIDRQSLWLDTAGGIIANIGRDQNFVSGAISLDGDLLIQIGGFGIATDSRFQSLNNAYRGGALDIRVLHDGFEATMIRIDKNGVSVLTPNTITYSARKIIMEATEFVVNADRLSLNERLVNKIPAVSI
jgi:hypothetical protein